MHHAPLSIDDQFRMVKESGVFDHIDRMPQPGQEKEFLDAVQKYALPLRTGLWSYMVGRDDGLIEKNLRISAQAGTECHNLMVYKKDVNGHVASDEDIAAFYRRAHEIADKVGITIGFEVHIYMWSEDFRRVSRVAEMVRRGGIPFNFILDHSHVLLKIDNSEEQDAAGIREDVEAGRFIIDPFEQGNVIDEWIAQNMVVWFQVRPASPNGPKNRWMMNDSGGWGRACQYPFVKPKPGEWHSPWHAYRVEPCKEVARRMLRYHRDHEESPLRWITTDMIDLPDYGGNVKYSLFDQNVAIAQWLRKTWDELKAESNKAIRKEKIT
jgi:hypothetical protein